MEPLRKCRTCGIEAWTREDLELFTKQKDNPYGRATQCKECKNTRLRKTSSIRKYGVSRELYEERMASSNICQCCKKTVDELEGIANHLCYDHDHDTMEFRGVLCTRCNVGIGLLGDKAQNLLDAFQYLNK